MKTAKAPSSDAQPPRRGAPARILVVKLSSFGDVIHTLPALTDLHAARPDIEVDWLVEEGFANLVARHPAVSEVHTVALRRLRWPPSRWPALLRHRSILKAALRARRYDMVIDAQGLMKSAVLARLAGAPIVGFDLASAREPATVRLYARRLPLGGHPHVVEQMRRFFASALDYPLPPGVGSAGLPRRSEGRKSRYGLVITAAGWPTKLWPEERWRGLVERIVAAGHRVVLPWGSEEERARAGRIAAGIAGAAPLPHRFTSDELADLAAGADFAVGLDTGVSHLAAAFDVPGVTLFGPTDPDHARPHGRGQRALRSDHPSAPCQQVRCRREASGRCCMERIELEAVWTEVAAILPQAAGSS